MLFAIFLYFNSFVSLFIYLFILIFCRVSTEVGDEKMASMNSFKNVLYQNVQMLFGAFGSTIKIDILKYTPLQIIIKVFDRKSMDMITQSLLFITSLDGKGCMIITDKISSFPCFL